MMADAAAETAALPAADEAASLIATPPDVDVLRPADAAVALSVVLPVEPVALTAELPAELAAAVANLTAVALTAELPAELAAAEVNPELLTAGLSAIEPAEIAPKPSMTGYQVVKIANAGPPTPTRPAADPVNAPPIPPPPQPSAPSPPLPWAKPAPVAVPCVDAAPVPPKK